MCPGPRHLQPRSELWEVPESRGREQPGTPLRSPDCCCFETPGQRRAGSTPTRNHLAACFRIANPLSSASAAVACPAKHHESQGIPQQQPWLIQVRTSCGFLHLGLAPPLLPTSRGDLCHPTHPPSPWCLLHPSWAPGYSQLRCLTCPARCGLAMPREVGRGQGHPEPLRLQPGCYSSPWQLPDGARATSSLPPSCTLLGSAEQGVGCEHREPRPGDMVTEQKVTGHPRAHCTVQDSPAPAP